MSTKDTPNLPKLGDTANKANSAETPAVDTDKKQTYKLLSRIVTGRGESKVKGSLIELTAAQAASKLYAPRVELYEEPKAS